MYLKIIIFALILSAINAGRIECGEIIEAELQLHSRIDICDGESGRDFDISITLKNQDELIELGYFGIELEYDKSSLKITSALKNNTLSSNLDLWQTTEDSISPTKNIFYVQAALFNGKYLAKSNSTKPLVAFRGKYNGDGQPVNIILRSIDLDIKKYDEPIFDENLDTLELKNITADKPDRILSLNVDKDSLKLNQYDIEEFELEIKGQNNNRINFIEIEINKADGINSFIKDILYDEDLIAIENNSSNYNISYKEDFKSTLIKFILQNDENLDAEGKIEFQIKEYNQNSCVTRTKNASIFIKEKFIKSIKNNDKPTYTIVNDGIILKSTSNDLLIFDYLGRIIDYDKTIRKIKLKKGLYIIRDNNSKINKIEINSLQ